MQAGADRPQGPDGPILSKALSLGKWIRGRNGDWHIEPPLTSHFDTPTQPLHLLRFGSRYTASGYERYVNPITSDLPSSMASTTTVTPTSATGDTPKLLKKAGSGDAKNPTQTSFGCCECGMSSIYWTRLMSP